MNIDSRAEYIGTVMNALTLFHIAFIRVLARCIDAFNRVVGG